jgi:aminoglycoside phosphotransferase (APT) family kinase protein
MSGLAREVGRLVRDRLEGGPGGRAVDGRAGTGWAGNGRAGALPRVVDDVTPDVLGALLARPVTGIARLEETAGTTIRARLAVDGPGAPTSVFVKLAPRAVATRLFVGLARLGTTEVSFYERLRATLPIAAPAAHAARYDPRTGRFALVLEDLGARGCRFADVRGAPSPAEAEAVVRTLATLHGAYGGPAPGVDLSWVVTHAADPAAPLTARLLRLVVARLRRTHPGLLPPGSALVIERQRDIEQRLPRDGFTLLHGDPHFGNVYFDDTVPGFVDWQVLRRGLGLRDLAYFLTLSLPTERRRTEERTLLALYLEELARHGGPALDPAQSWRRYRLLASYPFVAAAFTRAAGGLQAAEIADAGLRRASAALEDLDTLDEVRRLLA